MKANKFNLSHDKLVSADMGQLIPISLLDAIPRDNFQMHTSALVRVSPILAPIMHPTHAMLHHFFVPLRIIWDDFEDFITGGEDGTSAPIAPYMVSPADTGYVEGSLADYSGLPLNVPNYEHSALYMRAMALIYNEYFRDQDLEDPLVISKASGLDTTTSRQLQNVAWGKDYFTTSRPWPQKGPDTYLPLGDTAPVVTNNLNVSFNTAAASPDKPLWAGDTGGASMSVNGTGSPNSPLRFGTESGLEVDLTDATAVTITDLRTASAIQRYKELMARFGSRYTEYLRTIFGVKSSDARLQRPEYLGGGIQTIQFSEVLQTAEGTDPVGMMRGHGIGTLRSNRFRRFFEEHGIIVTFMSVKPKPMYVQGLHRRWSRKTKEDYFNPILQHIGQQEVRNSELYVQGTTADDGTFGWQDRYDEYRSEPSTISGEFRSTLDYWHMARIFSELPVLNSDFIRANPTDRIYASQDTNQLYIMTHHTVHARRPISKHASSFLS